MIAIRYPPPEREPLSALSVALAIRTHRASLRSMAREIKEGARAPAFRAASSGGGELALEELRGRWVILYFYPKDNTSG